VKVGVFTLPWIPGGAGFDDGSMQEFLSGCTVLEVVQHFFVHEKTPVLVLVVTYREAPVLPAGNRAPRTGARTSGPESDLSPEERKCYEALRSWRNQYARRVGRPPYMVLTNRQAAQVARQLPFTRAQLGEVPGIGASRLEDFGDELLAFLASVEQGPTAFRSGESSDTRTTRPPAGG